MRAGGVDQPTARSARFRKLGFIQYDSGQQLHSALLTVVLRD